MNSRKVFKQIFCVHSHTDILEWSWDINYPFLYKIEAKYICKNCNKKIIKNFYNSKALNFSKDKI